MKILAVLLILVLNSICSLTVQAKDMKEVSILYVKQPVKRPPVLSNLIEVPVDEGLSGARLALEDNNTTGRFTGQRFNLQLLEIDSNQAASQIVEALKEKTHSLVILDLPAASLQALIESEQADGRLLFNVSVADNHFRNQLCQKDLLHTLPSRAMLGDALAQYMVKKRWTKWALIEGPLSGDHLFAESLRRSAKKFGAKIVNHKLWDGARDARRTAQAEVPLLTRNFDYDVLMVADEWGDFGEYLMYRTWEPRVVSGTQGLFPTGWFWTIEQWGAVQLQNRFKELIHRAMTAKDYAAWVAVRSIGEAASRTQSVQSGQIADYIQSPKFELAAYKGRKLSYRPWSGQLRQPVALTGARSLVSQSPQEGFLHRISELDTLGFDQPEVQCVRK